MKMFSRIVCTLLMVFFFIDRGASQDAPIFQMNGGLVVMEAETAVRYYNWQRLTTIPGFTGPAYLFYNGPDLFNDPDNSVLTYRVRVDSVGTYRFQWRSRIAKGSSNTEHNDSWLRFPDASDFYAEKDGQRLYPKGSGRTPNPNGSGSGGWFKVYQNVESNWTWNTSTSDNDPHPIFVAFDSIGTYTLQVAGRSNGHAIDRLVLYHSSVPAPAAVSLNNSESVVLNPVSTKVITPLPVQLSPNPASDTVLLTLPSEAETTDYQISVVDLSGQSVMSRTEYLSPGAQLPIVIKSLPAGSYYLMAEGKQQTYRAVFIKK